MTQKQILVAELVRRMENATVGTFNPIWETFCKVIGENDPKNLERYIDRYGRKRK